ncbi:MAG: 6,7-dimethyl-8-ribityllumazine synthase [Patescibacteria group bacterium]|nr:6,7-dimethyl-8-ribityllumazine synthase [Patescibacteria group bacterium]
MIGIIVSEFNNFITDKLLESCIAELEFEYEVVKVPGAFEIPLVCKKLASKYDGFIALGCLIKGETDHYDAVCRACVDGLMQVQLETGKPIVFEVLMVHKMEDALARVDKGKVAAQTISKILKK